MMLMQPEISGSSHAVGIMKTELRYREYNQNIYFYAALQLTLKVKFSGFHLQLHAVYFL